MSKKYRMSLNEKSIYAVEMTQENSITYNVPIIFRVNKYIDYERLNHAFQKLCERHDILRTNFGIYKENFVQFVQENSDFKLEYLEDSRDIRDIAKEFITPFSLDKGNLLKALLVKKSLNEYYIVIDIHHIIYDGGSYNIFINELTKLYNGEELGKVKLQYKDFSVWQNKKSFDREKKYWADKLEDYPKNLEILPDFVRPAKKTFNGNQYISNITNEKTILINDFCNSIGITEYMFFMSVYVYLLSQYCRQDDVIVGTPLSGRINADIENMIGMFVNTMPLRINISKNITLKEYFEYVKSEIIDLFDNQSYPFQQLVNELNIERNSYNNPLFDYVLVFQNNESANYKIDDADLELIEYKSTVAPFDLTLNIELKEEAYKLKWEYNCDIFSEETIKTISSHFSALIDSFIKNVDGYLNQLECIDYNEKSQLLNKWNDTDKNISDMNFIELFEQQVQKTPNNIAVRCKNSCLTYKELEECSNYYADVLYENGVRRGDIVPIFTVRSIEMFISIMSIMKAGAAYLPIDPELPIERVKFMISNSNSKFAVLGVESEELISKIDIPFIKVDKNSRSDDRKTKSYKLSLDDIAYVIYTSGTSGMPKGVLVKHQGLANMCDWYGDYFKLDENSAVIQQFAFIFDGSVSEIFPGLTRGSAIEIATDDIKNNPKEFIDLCEGKMLITIPSLFKVLLEYIEEHNLNDKLKNIKSISLAGEATTDNIVKRYYEVLGEEEGHLFNLYGPTEASVCATFYKVQNRRYNIVPIGNALSNVKCYVFNEDKLCGIGMPGELCIAGKGVTKGYLNRNELNKEKFVENPYRKAETMYRTGDLVCRNKDGEIEFLGRIDDQVKIHGFRIELEEIEKRILQCEDIVDAVVVIKEKEKDKVICAYIVSKNEIDKNNLTNKLAETLPEYMLPRYIMQIDNIPVTKTGKLNKRALPEPVNEYNENFIEPKNEKEREIAKIFEEILDIKKISIRDNFFSIGGDSIKAIRIVAKLKEVGFNITVKNILEKKTIERIAEDVEIQERSLTQDKEVIGDVKQTQILAEFSNSNLKYPNQFNQSVLLEFNGKIDSRIMRLVLDELWKYHDIFRSKYKNNKLSIMPVDSNYKYDFYEETIKFDKLDDIEAALLKSIYKIECSFNLEEGPLLKAAVFHTLDKDFIFIVAHHLVIDGISWRIILDDINNLYKAIEENKEVKLPYKTTSFVDWANFLQESAEDYSILKEKEYWNEIVNKINLIKRDEISQNGVIKEVCGVLSKQDTEDLKYSINSKFNTEINDILLTALVRTLRKFYDNNKVSFFLEGHGREELNSKVNLDRTVGWFTSLYPVVIESDKAGIDNDIINVKETLRHVPNKGIGYGILTQANKVKLAENIEVTFNYLGEFTNENKQSDYFKMSNLSYVGDTNEENEFGSSLLFNSIIKEGKFVISIFYNSRFFEDGQANILKETYIRELKKVVKYCTEKSESTITPSDLGEYNWSLEEFNNTLEKFKFNNISVERIYPLTSMQEGMLFHKMQDKDSTDYIEQTVIGLGKKIDVDNLKDAINKLSDKHEVLRTNIFYREVDEPRQIISNRSLEVDYLDNNISKEEFKLFLRSDVNRGFDLENDSLIRFSIRKVDDDYKLLISFHHIILDGWCLSILLKDLSELTQEKISCSKYMQNHNKYMYENYVRYINDKDKKEALEYWRNLLEGFEEISSINTALPVAENEISDDAIQVFYDFSEEESRKIEKICSQMNVTMNTMFEAVWSIILQKYSSSNDVVYGKVVSGRNIDIKGIEDTVGLFINTIPVRVKINSNDTVSKLIQNISNQAIRSDENSFCTLAEIQDTTKKLSLFDSILVFENYYIDEKSKDLFSNIEYSREKTNYGITVSGCYNGVFSIDIMFDSKKYPRKFAKVLINQMAFVYKQIIKNIEIKSSDILLSDREEVKVLLKKFNQTSHEYRHMPVIRFFEEQVEKTPNNIAISIDNESLTYRELNSRANYLADKLVECGVKNNDIIPIMIDRSIDMIVAIYGVLKAGGAYVPIDCQMPIERINYMIDSCKSKLALANDKNLQLAESVNGLEVLQIEKYIGEKEENLLDVTIGEDDLIYIIYTSGTTGLPKGVMISNKSVSSRIQWQQEIYPMGENDVFLQNSTPTFDASIVEIFGWFLSGARLVLINPGEEKDPEKMIDIIWKNKVSTVQFTPSMLNAFLDFANESGNGYKLASLKYIIAGGEVLRKDFVNLFLDVKEKNKLNTVLLNSYGPTETTVDVLYYECSNRLNYNSPIGKAIWNTKAIIIDNGELCGIGRIGELCIAGDCVSLGYMGRDELTRENFVKSPLDESEVMYKTGDLACFDSNGDVIYVGRKDSQVKIRGYRIEIDEVENALKSIEGIEDSIVLPIKDDRSTYLCAYYITRKKIENNEMRNELALKLPVFMIPSYFIRIDSIPITNNGKVDKKALPKPEIKKAEYVEPKNDIEKKMAVIFEEVLEVAKVGVTDNFYEIGGDSIKAIRIVARMKKKGFNIGIKDIMRNPTIELLSSRINKTEELEEVAIEASNKYEEELNKANEIYLKKHENVQKVYPLTPMQYGMLYSNLANKDTDPYVVQSLYEVEGQFDYNILLKSIDIVAAKHEVLRTSILSQKVGKPIQVILSNREIEKSILKCNDYSEVIKYKEDDFEKGFDLERNSLLRVSILEEKDNVYILLTYHHIIIDGWSASIFMDELMNAYGLLEKKVDYNKIIESQSIDTSYEKYNLYLDGLDNKIGLDYWAELLDGYSDVACIMPENVSVEENNNNTLNDTVSKEKVLQIKKLCKKLNITLSTFFETLWGILLYKYTGNSDLVFGKVVSGRNHDIEGIEQCIGLFVNTIPVRIEIEDNCNFETLLKLSQEQDINSMQYDYCSLVDIQKQTVLGESLFSTLYAFENYLELDGEGKTSFSLKEKDVSGGVDYDISFIVYAKDQVDLAVVFDNKKYSSNEIKRILGRMKVLIDEVLNNIEINIADINILSYSEKIQVLKDFNNTEDEYDTEKTFMHLFNEQVEKNGRRTAVACRDRRITYRTLNMVSNFYADKLKECGVKKGDVVAIIAKRNIEVQIAILAIWKVGAAYLPVEPDLPIDRIKYMLEDSETRAILYDSNSDKVKDQLEKLKAIPLTKEWMEYSEELRCDICPSDKAYIIYTSGTTGKPKGVLIGHRSLGSLINWVCKYFEMDENTSVIQQFAFIFDGSVTEMFPCLTVGGMLQIVDDEIKNAPERFIELLPGKDMTIVPSLFKVILDVAESKNLQENIINMHSICAGGEELTRALVEQYLRVIGKNESKLINLYGPTEDTVASAFYPAKEVLDCSIPIGKAISNEKLYVLDKDNNLCGIGVPGELCIGGSGLSLGYLNREDLNKERFIDNPFNKGEKIYRTGDLARWKQEGNIEYLGRIDSQVKLRGFRIELEEIQNRLIKIEGINDGVVNVVEVGNEKYICGYVVSNEEVDEASILSELGKTLPEYMIPRNILQIEKIPTTKTGKINKRLLPIPEIHEDTEIKEPSTVEEKCLVEAFKEVLGLDEIGINQEFFKIGGDSIKAIRIVSRVRECGYELNVKWIMKEKSIEKIALKMTTKVMKKSLQENAIGFAPLTPIQQVYLSSGVKDIDHFNQSVLLESTELIDEDILTKTIAAILEYHDVLRAKYSYNKQYVRSMDEFEDMARVLDVIEAKKETEKVIERYSNKYQSNLSLKDGNLFKAVLFKGLNKDYIFIVIHHMVVDGVSWRILLEDIENIYSSLKKNEKVILPEKTISFKEWSNKLVEYSRSNIVYQEIPYWKNVNEKVSLFNSKWNVDFDKETKKYEISINPEITSRLINSCNSAFNTEINDLLITALARAFRKTFNEESIAFTMEGHGRENVFEDSYTDRTVGWFTTMYPITVQVKGGDIGLDIISVKEELRKISNHGFNYGVLSCLSNKIESNLSLFSFNYLGEFKNEHKDHNFNICNLSHGDEVSSLNKFGTAFSINGLLMNNRIQFMFEDMADMLTDEENKTFISNYRDELIGIAEYCSTYSEVCITASDLGETSWDIDEFNKVSESVGGSNEIERIYPLTSLQTGILFDKLTNKDSTAYVLQSVFEIQNEDLDLDRLIKVFDILGKKHEVLRTSIRYTDVNEPRQVLLRNRKIEVQFFDFSNYQNCSDEVENFIKSDVKRGFDLEKDSLLRATIIKDNTEKYILIISCHHIIVDGWCVPILINDICDIYSNIDKYLDVKDNLEGKYEEFVRYTLSKNLKNGYDYWKNLLSGYEASIDINSASIEEKDGKDKLVEEVALTSEDNDKLLKFALENGVTVNTVVEAAVSMVIGAYSNSDDIILGRVVSGRNVPIEEIESVIGLFINTIPARINLEKDKLIRDLLKDIQSQDIESEEYSSCSLVDIFRESGLNSDAIKVLFVFENYYGEDKTSESKLILDEVTAREETDYDLSVAAFSADTLHINVTYKNSVYECDDAKLLLQRIKSVVRQIINSSDEKVKDIYICKEDIESIKEFNQTYHDIEKKTVIDLFEENVVKLSNRIALKDNNNKLTYKELGVKVNCLVNKLCNEGVNKGDVVGIMSERSIDLIIAVYAVLKAGAVYMPIGVDWPLDRINYMIKDSNTRVILAGSNVSDRMSEIQGAKKVSIADNCNEDNVQTCVNRCDLENVAYIIYTSGTTGNPKGVKVPNSALTNLIQYMNSSYFSDEGHTIMQRTTYTFDASIWEIFVGITSGNELYMLPVDGEKEPKVMLEGIVSQNVTSIQFAPSMLFGFLEYVESENLGGSLRNLKYVFAGGEELKLEYVKLFREIKEKYKLDMQLVNLYGPTEAAVNTLYYNCTFRESSIIPVGKPPWNTRIYIMNNGKPCGLGLVGELCIAGDQLSYGYMNLEELTSQKFVEDKNISEKIYKTGDLAAWNKDGTVRYFGRIDDQVKIRGYRIEIPEIENRLCKIEGIRNAVVIAREIDGSKYLCAYIIGNKSISEEYIRQELAKNLPSYMLPSFYTMVDKFLMTSNGKLDKKSLPLPHKKSSRVVALPSNSKERAIYNTIKEVLKVNDLSMDDNFFEIGGDSIRAIRLVSYLKKKGFNLNVKDIMQAKYIKNMALLLKESEVQVEEFYNNIDMTISGYQESFKLKNEYWNVELKWKNDYCLDYIEKSMKKVISYHGLDGEYGLQIKNTIIIDNKQISNDEDCIVRICIEEKDSIICKFNKLIFDLESVRILLQDFNYAYMLLEKKYPIILPECKVNHTKWISENMKNCICKIPEVRDNWLNKLDRNYTVAEKKELIFSMEETNALIKNCDIEKLENTLIYIIKDVIIGLNNTNLKNIYNLSSLRDNDELLRTIANFKYFNKLESDLCRTGENKLVFEFYGDVSKSETESFFYDISLGKQLNNYVKSINIISFVKDGKLNMIFINSMKNNTIFESLIQNVKDEMQNYIQPELNYIENEMIITSEAFEKKWGRGISRRVNIEHKSYNIVFVENLTVDKLNDLQNDNSEFAQADMILDMECIKLAKAYMSEEEFYNMCNNQVLSSYCSNLEFNNKEKIEKLKVLCKYKPTKLQNQYLDWISVATIPQKINLTTSNSPERILERVKDLIKDQEVLRSLCIKKSNKYTIWVLDKDNDFYIPYYDMRYKNSHDIKKLEEKIQSNNKWNMKEDELIPLSYLTLVRVMNNDYILYLDVSHSIWDKVSSLLFEDMVKERVLNKGNISKGDCFMDYIKEIKGLESIVNEYEMLDKKFSESIDNVNLLSTYKKTDKMNKFMKNTYRDIKKFIKANKNNKLVKQELCLVELTEKEFIEYQQASENVIKVIVQTIALSNNMVNKSISKLPVLVVQEERNHMKGNYENALGIFLDYLPICIDQNDKNFDLEENIRGVQELQKESNINFSEMLTDLCGTNIIDKVLSINYQGMYELNYKEALDIMFSKAQQAASYEIFINSYGQNLLISYPVSDKCSGDINNEIVNAIKKLLSNN